MSRVARRVNVESAGDLLRVLDDVKEDHEPRIIEKEGENVAAVIDIGDLHRVLAVPPGEADIEAAFAVVGAWKDVDAVALKRSIYEGRRTGSRPASRPA